MHSQICLGREFERVGAATEKAPSPQVRCWVPGGGVRRFASDERMERDNACV